MIIIKKIIELSKQQIKKTGCQYYAFSIFAMLNYAAPMFVTYVTESLSAILVLQRIIAVLLCFGLIFADYWPKKWRQEYFPLYWYSTLCFCLPFLSSYTVLITDGTEWWVFNGLLSLILLIMLTDWRSFIVLTSLGLIFSLLLYLPSDLRTKHYVPSHDIYLFGYLCIFMLLSVFLFLRKKENIQTERIEIMKIFGSAIAHEVNSPIAAIRMLSMTLNDLKDDIEKCAAKKTIEGDNYYSVLIPESEYELLTDIIPDGLTRTSQEASKVVEMLLLALKDRFGGKEDYHSIKELTQIVLDDYGFTEEQKKKISYDLKNDFYFFGSKQMIKHVIYNLIRNALKYGGKDVTIEIWLENNKLYFKDNGLGISKENIKKIFNSFYTNSLSGTGIGLAFCKTVMKSIGGTIECESKEGSYTKFTLDFPVVDFNESQ